MRIAFIGKGGSGKSTTVGVFARLLARSGERTIVVDSDVMPGLATALGIDVGDDAIPLEAVVPADEHRRRFRLRDGLTADQAALEYAHTGPDGLRLLQMGKLRDDGPWSLAPSQQAYRQIIRELPRDDWHVIADLPGGTRQPFFGWGGFADRLLVVVEPTVKSFVTARRLRRLAEPAEAPALMAVANKVTSPDDVRRIRHETGLEVVAAIPYDESVREADRRGVALIDTAPDSPAVTAITSLLTSVREVLA